MAGIHWNQKNLPNPESVQGAQAKVDAHANLTTAHNATSSATANRMVVRDSAGRARFADPSNAADAATKGYVDGIGTNVATANTIMRRDSSGRAKVASPSEADDIARKDTVDNHANLTNAHGATASATANRIVLRDSGGRASFADPTQASHAATKGWVEQMIEGSSGATWIGPGSTTRLEALATRTGSKMSLVKRFRIGANGATRVTLDARAYPYGNRYVDIQVGERLISSLHWDTSWISYTIDEEVYYIVDPPGRILEVRVGAWAEEEDDYGEPHIVYSDAQVRNVRVRWNEIPSPPALVSEVLSN